MSFLLGSVYGPQKKEEEFHKGKFLIRTAIIISAIVTIFSAWTQQLSVATKGSNSASAATTTSDLALRLFLALGQTFVVWADYVLHPAPRKKEDPEIWHAQGLGVGVFCWFTGQSLVFQMIYHWFSFIGAFTQDAQLAAGVSFFSTWITTQSCLLTTLFLVLNWGEPKWQKEFRPKMEKTFPHFGYFQLSTHTPNCALALIDFFVVQTKANVLQHAFSFQTAIVVGISYAVVYSLFLYAVHDYSKISIYPFVSKLTSLKVRVIFVCILSTVVVSSYFGFHYVRTVLF